MPTALSPEQTAQAAGLARVDPKGVAAHGDVDVEKARKDISSGAEKQKVEKGPKIDNLQQAQREMERFQQAKSEEAINKTIDTSLDVTMGVDSTGAPIVSTGAERMTLAKEGRDAALRYLDKKGFDNLTPAEQVEARAQIIEVFPELFGGEDAINILTTQGKLDDVVDVWLKNPDFRHNFRELAKKLINTPPNSEEWKQRIETVRANFKTADTSLSKLNAEFDAKIAKNGSDLVLVETALEEFSAEEKDAGGIVTKPAGPKRAEITTREGEIKAEKAGYDGERLNLDNIIRPFGITYNAGGELVYTEAQMNALMKSKGGGKNLQEAIRLATELKNSPYEAAIRARDELLARETQLKSDKARLETEQEQIISGITAAADRRVLADTEVAEAERARVDGELAYANSWKNLFSEAMRETLDQEDAYYSSAMDKTLNEEAAVEEDPAKKALKSALGSYYSERKIDKGRIKSTPNKDRIKEHLELLTTTDRTKLVESFINPATGKNYTKAEIAMAQLSDPTFYDQFGKTQPEAIMRHLLMSQKNAATGKNYTLAEVNTMLSSASPEALKDMMGQTAEQLVIRGIVGKHINTKELNMILEQDWGGEDLMTRVENNSEVKKKFEEWEKDTGWKGKMWNEAKKHKKAGLWALLLIMFPSIGAVAGGVVLTKAALTSKGGGGGGHE